METFVHNTITIPLQTGTIFTVKAGAVVTVMIGRAVVRKLLPYMDVIQCCIYSAVA